MNIGTIVEAPLVKVRLINKRRFGPMLGEIEEYFVNLLRPGDTFMFAGRLLRFLRLHENVVECAEGGTGEPMVPAYQGGRLPLTTNLADRVRGLQPACARARRSEEHTSELQSLDHISYAVFCLDRKSVV